MALQKKLPGSNSKKRFTSFGSHEPGPCTAGQHCTLFTPLIITSSACDLPHDESVRLLQLPTQAPSPAAPHRHAPSKSRVGAFSPVKQCSLIFHSS